MSRIDDTLIHTVFYIYPSEDDARVGSEYGGTGFIIAISIDGNSKLGFHYAVSNAHVIKGINADLIFLRINNVENKFDIIETNKTDWICHPYGDDVAVCLININLERFHYSCFKREHFISHDFIQERNVGVGDDVVMIGRFRVYAGKRKNLPTAMFGHIAQMPSEPLFNPFTKLEQESFLVEMKSIKGFSGSPVILYIQAFTNRFDSTNTANTSWFQRLLGIDWGQIQYEVQAIDNYGQNTKLTIDSAITGVVPAWKILELIDGEELKSEREKIENYYKISQNKQE